MQRKVDRLLMLVLACQSLGLPLGIGWKPYLVVAACTLSVWGVLKFVVGTLIKVALLVGVGIFIWQLWPLIHLAR